ncbi:hypothetical protein LY78DRAFT_17880 [Colletotrichum sublineola]|nr:hypothetical protein LY78DRAFT_17880 [Colletotrichum sublineola]
MQVRRLAVGLLLPIDYVLSPSIRLTRCGTAGDACQGGCHSNLSGLGLRNMAPLWQSGPGRSSPPAAVVLIGMCALVHGKASRCIQAFATPEDENKIAVPGQSFPSPNPFWERPPSGSLCGYDAGPMALTGSLAPAPLRPWDERPESSDPSPRLAIGTRQIALRSPGLPCHCG